MTGPDGVLAARASAWRDADPDPETRAELGRLLGSGDTAALAERFEGALAFGTAGIRAETGAGPMRMNRLVAGRVGAGLARMIDHTLLAPEATDDDVTRLAREAGRLGVGAVCVSPARLPLAPGALAPGIAVAAVAGP